MEILALTVLLSTLLALFFLLLFWRDRKQPTHRSLEQDSLLPLELENNVEAKRK